MHPLRQQLATCAQGRLCVVGLGNPMAGDDGFGMHLVAALRSHLPAPTSVDRKLLAPGVELERCLSTITKERFDHIVLCDAVDFGEAPGAVVWLSADEIAARLPQLSTHRLSLGLVARLLEANGTTRAWLLGVQVGSCRPSPALSPPVAASTSALVSLWLESWQRPTTSPPTPAPGRALRDPVGRSAASTALTLDS